MEELKKKICRDKCKVEDIILFDETLEKELLKPSVLTDLPNLLDAVYKLSLHEDKKIRDASISPLKNLVNLLDLNKHLKNKSWWSEMKAKVLKSTDTLMQLMKSGDENWAVFWCESVKLLGSDLKSEVSLLNKLLKIAEISFKASNDSVKLKGFLCWRTLIDNFAIRKEELNNRRKLSLLVIPLKAKNHNSKPLFTAKFETWKHLLSMINQHSDLTVELVVSKFLEFMFMSTGPLPAGVQVLGTDCATVLLTLLNTPGLFTVGQLPDLMISCVFVCMQQMHKQDPKVSLNVWEALLENLKHAQWPEESVTKLLNGLEEGMKHEKLGKSRVFAEMVHKVFSGPKAMTSDLLIKHCNTLILLMLEPQVLVNFTESWCNELLDIVLKCDPILLPQNILSDVIDKLRVLSTSEMFRDEKLKLLRAIWMAVSNIFCKFLSDNAQMGKRIDSQNEINNANILLCFGAAELSSMWNKLQMKSWKTLYSESVKFCSLMPEANKFISDLVEALLKDVRENKVPLHVAVDLASIILELHLSKDASSILPLLMEITYKGVTSLQNDISGTPTVMAQFLKTVVAAARNEPALVSDISVVVERMVDDMPIASKYKSMALKAQHQLQTLKPNRVQDKAESPTTTPTSSPTVTSFLHRLAKAKENQSKMASPTSSQSSDKSSSPVCTPNSKKASSFVDMKSEDFVFVPPKTRKTILTDHQKETLTARKHDIPALYQDLSQDSSQSTFDSIVTTVKTVEGDVENVKVLRSPRKQQNTFELGLKVLTPKKSLNVEGDEIKLNDKKQNESSVTSVLDNNEGKTLKNKTLRSPLKASSLNGKETVTNRKEPVTSKINQRSGLRSSLTAEEKLIPVQENTPPVVTLDDGENTPVNLPPMVEIYKDISKTSIDFKDKIPKTPESIKQSIPVVTIVESDSDSETRKEKIIPPKQDNTPDVLLKTNNASDKKKRKRKSLTEPNLAEGADTNQKVKSPKVKTPKVSPRRLRKRKSGVTPVLSEEVARKKRLSLVRSSSIENSTPKSVRVDNPQNAMDIEEEISEKELKNDNKEGIEVADKSSKEAKEECLSEIILIDKNLNESELKEVTDILKTSAKAIVCSPVKIVLKRCEQTEHPAVDSSLKESLLCKMNIKDLNNSKTTNDTIENGCDTSITVPKVTKKLKEDKCLETKNSQAQNQDENTLKNRPDLKENETRRKSLRSSNNFENTDQSFETAENSLSITSKHIQNKLVKQTEGTTDGSPKKHSHFDSVNSNKCSVEQIDVSTTKESKTELKVTSPSKPKEMCSLRSKHRESEQETSTKDDDLKMDISVSVDPEANSNKNNDKPKSSKTCSSNNTDDNVQVDLNTTPAKQVHKSLKQTQLPFTPIGKSPSSKSNVSSSLVKDSQNVTSVSKENHTAEKCARIVLKKINPTEVYKKTESSESSTKEIISPSCLTKTCENNTELTKSIVCRPETNTDQNEQRTPEKHSPSPNSRLDTRAKVTEETNSSGCESPTKLTESEDIIAGSQETDYGSISISMSAEQKSIVLSPPKLLTKSPKKNENSAVSNIVSERVLRSSPLKSASPSRSSTPKKSVCRRLDVEIDEDEKLDLDIIKENTRPTSPETELVNNSFEEMSNDVRLLNGQNHKESSEDQKECSNETQATSPTCQKGLKRLMDSNSSSIESPKRSLKAMKFDNVGSPKSSSSRTNQMMELAMQDKEKTVTSSSPVSSLKKRRVQTVRLGPVNKTPKSLPVSVRTHNGPSEDWVRRTYSPTASPNSSILKRRIDSCLPSPDSSPPSNKKKRVSFSDPPVSKSLLFSKEEPDKGQIQRSDPKKECESEEVVSQGSVQVELSPERLNSEVVIFSPLRECSHPVAEVLERTVSRQWQADLQAQLERLGVNTIGQLSSLTEATVQRLPFIPPKVERLRKILQNYSYEIEDEKSEVEMQECDNSTTEVPTTSDDVQLAQDVLEEVEAENKEETQKEAEENEGKSDNEEEDRGEVVCEAELEKCAMSKDRLSDDELLEIAKKHIEQVPLSLIPRLGASLDFQTVYKMFQSAVDKMTTQNDKSS